MKNRGATKSWWSKKTKAVEMCALKFCVLLMFVSGKCCAIVVFFSPTKSWFLRQTHVVVPTFQSWFVLVSVTSCQIQNKICERARGAPHEHKLLANDFMGSTLGFVKMQCPQLTDAQTQGRCIACLETSWSHVYCHSTHSPTTKLQWRCLQNWSTAEAITTSQRWQSSSNIEIVIHPLDQWCYR